MKKLVVRVGQRLVVRDARVVVRVGYPRSVESYVPEVDVTKVRELMRVHGVGGDGSLFEKIRAQLAYGLAKKDGFGGRERSVHLKAMPELEGRMVEVFDLRTVVTGTYCPARDGGYWDPYDAEPACLVDVGRVRLASVWACSEVAELRPMIMCGEHELPVSHLACPIAMAIEDLEALKNVALSEEREAS